MISASIIIPIKNGESNIKECLESILNQDYPDGFEIITIDSGSTDNTLSILQKFPVRLFRINPEDFHHATTRNYGAELARGEFLVFLSHDVTPKSRLWLRNITENLRNPWVAGVSGKQIPRPDAKPMECHWLSYFYPNNKIVVNPHGNPISISEDSYYFFSDANSSIKRDLLLKYKFPENVIMAEDKAWCRKILLEGYTIVYEPQAEVYHSHAYDLKRAFQTFFDGGMAYSQFCSQNSEVSWKTTLRQATNYLKSEMIFLLRNRYLKYIPYALFYDAAKFLGRIMGKNHRYLPKCINMLFCHHKEIYLRMIK
jgi:rhamnosyltransferase